MLFMGFEGMEEPSRHISFGTSAERPTFPNQIAHDRFGNENNPFRGVKDVGPGQYNNNEFTTFTYFNKPISNKGFIFGARTAQRQFYELKQRAPSPTHYQNVESKNIKPTYIPFSTTAKRFENDLKDSKPGPGAYEHNVERNRSVQSLHSFGGRTKSVPHIDIKCTVHNNIKCNNCNQVPNGDFYQYKSNILCNRCYEYNYKWQEKYNRAYLESFKKARDCSFIHEHNGTTAAIQKVSDKELRKLKQKEAYLSLYWS